MGWAGGYEIFDPVAKLMVDYNVPDEVMTDIAEVLIRSLQNRGWDTEAESLGAFHDTPAIVEAFALRGIYRAHDMRNPDYAELKLEHVEMYPDGCKQSGCGFCPPHKLPETAYGGDDEPERLLDRERWT